MTGFETHRANRQAAWSLFNARLAQVKADLAARSVGGRIAAKAKNESLAVADEALAVARESKGLIALGAAALISWAFRAPLLGWVSALLTRSERREPANDDMAETTEEQAR